MIRDAYRRLLEVLARRYPYLFGGKRVGISIAPGWLAIVERLRAQIDAVLDPAEKGRVRVVQIKEKLGGLRFYWDSRPMPSDGFVTGSLMGTQQHQRGDGSQAAAVAACHCWMASALKVRRVRREVRWR